MPKTTSKTTLKNPFMQFHARHVALWGAVVMLGCVFAAVLFYRLFAQWLPVDALLSPMLLFLFYGTFGYWMLNFLQQQSIQLPVLMGPLPRRWRWPRLAALVALLLLSSLGSFLVWFGLRNWLFPGLMANGLEASLTASFPSLWFAQVMKFMVLVLMAPVVEELLFRGIILQRWAVRWGIRPAILLSSLVFGSCHASNPVGFTLFGLVMALLYVSTRSLLIPIVCHMLNNAMAEVLLMFNNGRNLAAADLAAAAGNSFWQGILLLAIALPLLVLFVRQTWPRAAAAIPYLVNLQHGRSNLMQRPTLARSRR